MARASQSLLECCNGCIGSMGLIAEQVMRPRVSAPAEPRSHISGKGITGVDIMTKDEVELASDFNSRIRNAREHRGLSQEDLARKMNEKIGVIQKAENGIRPTDSLVNKFAKALDVRLFVESVSHGHTMVTSESDRQMTISDAKKQIEERPKKKKAKKKVAKKKVAKKKGAKKK